MRCAGSLARGVATSGSNDANRGRSGPTKQVTRWLESDPVICYLKTKDPRDDPVPSQATMFHEKTTMLLKECQLTLEHVKHHVRASVVLCDCLLFQLRYQPVSYGVCVMCLDSPP